MIRLHRAFLLALSLTLSACGSTPAQHDHAAEADGIAYYTCPMHPSIQQHDPGQCPICGMDLTPVTTAQQGTGEVLVDEAMRRRAGVVLSPVTEREIIQSQRAMGQLTVPPHQQHAVTLRTDVYVEQLVIDRVGTPVRAGQRLATVYGPELVASSEALRSAQRLGQQAAEQAAARRLRGLGLSQAGVDALREGATPERVPLGSPVSGTLLSVSAQPGARVPAGEPLFVVADLTTLWVEASLPPEALPALTPGLTMILTLPASGQPVREAALLDVLPSIDPMTRTATLRAAVDGDGLRPGQWAELSFALPRGTFLTVPTDAVIYAGDQRLVFVDAGEGRLRPQVVTLGPADADGVAVLTGLTAQDHVVSRGAFLIAAESRLRSASELWRGSVDGPR